MKSLILYIFLVVSLASCKKDNSIEPQNNNCSGTSTAIDTLAHKYKFKLKVDGVSIPDSVDFVTSSGYDLYGSHYFKRYINPSLSLSDSGLVIAKVGNDISIIVYSSDTTKSFSTSIFISESLRLQKTANTNSITHKTTTKYYF